MLALFGFVFFVCVLLAIVLLPPILTSSEATKLNEARKIRNSGNKSRAINCKPKMY